MRLFQFLFAAECAECHKKYRGELYPIDRVPGADYADSRRTCHPCYVKLMEELLRAAVQRKQEERTAAEQRKREASERQADYLKILGVIKMVSNLTAKSVAGSAELPVASTVRVAQCERHPHVYETEYGIGVWQGRSDQPSLTFGWNRAPKCAFALSPDSRSVLVGSAGGSEPLAEWDVTSGKRIRIFQCEGEVRELALSKDGRVAASVVRREAFTNAPHTIWFWDMDTSSCIGKTPQLTDDASEACYINSIELSSTGSVLVTSHGRDSGAHISVWRVPEGKEVQRCSIPGERVYLLRFSDDDSVLLFGDYRWQYGTVPARTREDVIRELSEQVQQAVRDGSLVSGLALYHASETGQDELALLLLQAGAQVDRPDSSGITPLLRTSINGHLETAAVLVAHGANPYATTARGETPLHYAAEGGNIRLAEFFLDKGVRIDVLCNAGRTPLYNAVLRGRAEMVRFLLSNGADPNIRADDGLTSLGRALDKGFSEIAAILQQSGARE